MCSLQLTPVEQSVALDAGKPREEQSEPVSELAADATAEDATATIEDTDDAKLPAAADDDLASNVRGERKPTTEIVSDAHEVVMPAPPMAAGMHAHAPPSPLTTLVCYSHSECPDSQTFCASDNRCYASSVCADAVGPNRLTAIDSICPHGAPAFNLGSVPQLPPTVKQVVVFAGQFVDQIHFVLSNATVLKYGDEGGDSQQPWKVPDGEWITWVKVRQGGNLDSIQFFTNRGNSSPVYGGQGGRKQIFHVDREHQMFGLERSDGLAAPITGIVQFERTEDAAKYSQL